MATTSPQPPSPVRPGIGLRLPHIAEVVATRPAVGMLEIHPENFLANPHARELLIELGRVYPISVHTVGVSIGSADGIDRVHLSRLRALVDDIDPALVSGHLAWSTFDRTYLNDLLPMPYTEESLDVVAAHLREVQDHLHRRMLVENPSSYVSITTSTMSEAEFLNELVIRTGCGVLCDVSNVYLSAHNMDGDAIAFIDALPMQAVGELHLGGFTAEDDEATPGSLVLIDTHAAAVAEPAWDLYAHAVARFGPTPTIIEWDNDLPALPALCEQAARAEAICRRDGVTAVTHAAR